MYCIKPFVTELLGGELLHAEEPGLVPAMLLGTHEMVASRIELVNQQTFGPRG
jgi:hypothetical protein